MNYEDLSEDGKKFVDDMASAHGKSREEVIAQFVSCQSDGFKSAGILS